ncbi:uncharacterized protein DDB_G0290685-like isoform X1 [Acanthopagrus latus]|uniref:uncharacterized protein DDB_G0290685-like isoform X1 n=1 Tax=Acanthopagrus latus TaxID=8177 RepID=UPI00187BCCF2|nr:uncharacterized protein DDB_G0290685-like isoform X1 [Acanthopagrus latus]
MMHHQTDRLTWKSLIFRHAVVFLLLTHSREGLSQGNGQSSELISALLGESITLPCHVSPATDAVNTMLEWARPDLDPRFVHVRRDGEDRLIDQHSSYKGRTSVSIDGLRRGDMSLKLSKVKFSDEGTYRCFVPGFGTDTSIKLVVDVFIKITNVSRGVLQCESTGWYPEPEVFWLDGEGNLLSAGPTETVRGPDDLYTVSSRVTVEKRHSNSFTCRVQQHHINQIREAHIHVPEDFFKEPSGSGSSVAAIIFALAGVTLVLSACFVVWKRRQRRNSFKPNHSDEETTGGGDASEQEHLIQAAEGETLRNQSEMEVVNNSKYEQTGWSGQIEEEKPPEKFSMEVEENVETGSQCVVENERQQDEVQTTEDLDNMKKTTESASEGSSDQEETETEKPEKSEDMGDREEGTKSETEDQALMERGRLQPVGASAEAMTDPYKAENKEQTQTESAGQSPADGGTQGDQTPAGEETNLGLQEKSEETKSVSEGSQDQEETNGRIQDDHPPAGEETNLEMQEKTEHSKAEDGGGGDKTTSTEENSTPQSPVDGQTGHFKDTDGHNTLDESDKNKEAEKSTDNVTTSQGQTAGQTQHEDSADEGRQSNEDTDSDSDNTKSPSSVNPETNTGRQTSDESEKSSESRDGDKNKTSGDDVTTPDQTSAKDGESGEEKEDDDHSQRVNDAKNEGDDTDALSNSSGSQDGLDGGQDQVDEDKESGDGTSD